VLGWLVARRALQGPGPCDSVIASTHLPREEGEAKPRWGGKQVVASMRGMMDDGVARGSAAPPPCTPARPLCGGPPTIPPWKKESLSPLLASPSRKVTLH
jgi:hypothetical protein